MNDDDANTPDRTSILDKVPRLILDAVLLLALTPVLTPTNPVAAEPEFKKTIGVYDDWTAYLLQDGELQICYAETTLIPAPGAAPALSAVRFQVSHHTFDGITDSIRFTPIQTLPLDSYSCTPSAPVGQNSLIA